MLAMGAMKFLHSEAGKKIMPFITLLFCILLISFVIWIVLNYIEYQNKNQKKEENNEAQNSNGFNIGKCHNCGYENNSTNNFCTNCGAKLTKNELS